MKCPKCGGEVQPGMPMCPRCGQHFVTQSQQGKYCAYCKAVIPATATVCSKCGRAQPQQTGTQKQAAGKPAKEKKKGGFRWWYVPIMIVLVLVGYVIGVGTSSNVPTKEPKKTSVSSKAAEGDKEDKDAKGDSEKEDLTKENSSTEEIVPLTESEIREMYSDPDNFSGRAVELTGKVFGGPEYDENGVAFQMWRDPTNNDQNTLIAYPNGDITINDGDFVRVLGIVVSSQSATNAFGAVITMPLIYAESMEIVSYKEAVAPTLYTVTPANNSQTQYGYSVTVEKVELAASETRVYLKVDNNGTDKFNLYSFNAKLVQNGKQFEEQHNYSADYPEVQTDLLAGVSTEGIICFPAIENASFQLIFEANSDNWDESFSPYTFDVPAE